MAVSFPAASDLLSLHDPGRWHAGASPAERILDAFDEWAARAGVRRVVMAELAASLGISTKTLYREYRSKDALVAALAQRWACRVRAALDRMEASADPDVGPLLDNLSEVLLAVSHYCPAFWADLERDHPSVAAEIVTLRREGRERVTEWLRPRLDPSVDGRVAGELLLAHLGFIEQADRAQFPDRAALLDQVIRIWAHGALQNTNKG